MSVDRRSGVSPRLRSWAAKTWPATPSTAKPIPEGATLDPAGVAHRTEYRPDIDGLRAVAVLAVVLYHAGLGLTSGGFVGVDVFFVISGYVISKSLLADLQSGRFSVTGFYERRIRRIFPALVATMLATWIVAFALLLPSYFLDFSRSLVATAAFVSNVYFWKNSGYFANGADLRPLLHTWTLSVEEQFYIFAPLTLFLVFRYLRRNWWLTLGPLALASLALSIVATRIGPTANFFLLPMRAWELLIGALLALAPPPAPPARWSREALAAIGLALIAYAVFAYTPATPFPGLAALPPCLGAALLIYVGSSGGSFATGALSVRPMVAVGLISYSLYLVHWPIVSFLTYYQLQPPGPAEVPLILAASLVLATLSWRFVEQPFRNRSFRPPRKVVIGGGLAAMGLAGMLGAAGVVAHGFPGRFPGFADRAAGAPAGAETGCFLDSNPDPRLWNASACTITHGGPEKLLLWGDSYANHYAPGLKAHAALIPYTVIEYAAAGCPPVLSYSAYSRPGCHAFNQAALALIRREGVRKVVLSARWVDLQRRGLGELGSTLKALSALGIETYVIGQSPMFTTDVHVIAFRQGASGPEANWPISFDPELNRRLAAMTPPGHFVDPLGALCQGAVCPYRDGGRFLFSDEGHFSEAGSALAVARFFPLVARPALRR
jgi:peptidoglycan/LPS O-acetylase OafA/YrhL